MVRLASVEFTKLKNVRPGTRLVFPEAGAVLLGKNGTGKTTLLQYLVALCTADMSAFVSDDVALTEKGYPADRVYALGKSFTASVDAALSCQPLLDALSQLSTSVVS